MCKYDFLVREEVQRDRIYTIEAKSEVEARDLLDGFRQEPKVGIPSKENEVVGGYYIKEIWLPPDAPEEV